MPQRESTAAVRTTAPSQRSAQRPRSDVYFSADVETDGPIPGPFSMLSFALVFAGRFDGEVFSRPKSYEERFYAELEPICMVSRRQRWTRMGVRELLAYR